MSSSHHPSLRSRRGRESGERSVVRCIFLIEKE